MQAMPPGGILSVANRAGAHRRGLAVRRACAVASFAALAIVACDRTSARSGYSGTPEVIGDTLLRFPDGSEYVSGFRNIEFIGSIPAETKAPFLIIAGNECADCDAPPSVLLRSPSDGPVRDFSSLAGWHPYPGRVIAYNEDSVVVAHSRLFWGQCMPERPPGLIEYRTDYGRNGLEPRREVRITEVEADSLLEWRRDANVRLLATTLVQVQARVCTEIAQRDMPAPP
jgi:hypothetical protein